MPEPKRFLAYIELHNHLLRTQIQNHTNGLSIPFYNRGDKVVRRSELLVLKPQK